MAAEHFKIMDENPNEGIGGGGCVCSDTKVPNCVGPYAVFFATETDSNVSPHVVCSLSCAEAVVAQARPARPRKVRKDADTDVVI